MFTDSRIDFPGEQANAVMIGQELQPRLGLIPGLRTEQLFGIGAIAERGFLKAEESFTMTVTPSPVSV